MPSSKYLGSRIVKRIKMKKGIVIVELGSGTGVFTIPILKKMPDDGILLAFEINHKLAEYMRKTIKDDRLVVIEDDAAKFGHYLKKLKLPLADYVVSGLPIADFSRKDRQVLLSSIEHGLQQKGTYLQFQYLPLSLLHVKKVFQSKIVGLELRNIPPAFIYECRKKVNCNHTNLF